MPPCVATFGCALCLKRFVHQGSIYGSLPIHTGQEILPRRVGSTQLARLRAKRLDNLVANQEKQRMYRYRTGHTQCSSPSMPCPLDACNNRQPKRMTHYSKQKSKLSRGKGSFCKNFI